MLADPSISPYGGSLRISSDTNYLAAIGQNGGAYLCDLRTSDAPQLLKANHRFTALQFTPDDQYLLTAGDDGKLTRWKVHTGEIQEEWVVGESPRETIDFFDQSADGKIVAATKKRFYIFDMRTGLQTDMVEGEFSAYCSPKFCRSGSRLAVLSADGDFLFFRVSEAGKVEWVSASAGHRGSASYLESLGGTPERLATFGGENRELRLWDASTGQILATYRGHGNDVYCLGISRDGHQIATGGRDTSVLLWQTGNQYPLSQLNAASSDWRCIWSLAFSNDGRTLLSGDETGTIRLWDVSTGTQAGYLMDDSAGEKGLSAQRAHTGKTLVRIVPGTSETAISIGWDGVLKAWSLSSRSLLRERQTEHKNPSSLALSPDGTKIYIGDDAGSLRCWRTSDLSELDSLRVNVDWDIWATACTQDLLAFGGTDSKVHIWSLSARSEVQVLDHHTDYITSLDFSGDGMSFASGSHDGTVRLWHVQPGALRLTEAGQSPLRAHTSDVIALQFYPDGKSLASAGFDQVVYLWDFETGTVKSALHGHRHWIFSLAFSPDAATLATGSFSSQNPDSMIRLWRTAQSP